MQGYPSDAQLFTGSIGLDGNHLRQFGLISWIDKLAPVAGPRGGAGTGTASYEQVIRQAIRVQAAPYMLLCQ